MFRETTALLEKKQRSPLIISLTQKQQQSTVLQLPGGFFWKMNVVFLLFTEADELLCSNLVVIVPISLLLFEFILCTQHYCMSGRGIHPHWFLPFFPELRFFGGGAFPYLNQRVSRKICNL